MATNFPATATSNEYLRRILYALLHAGAPDLYPLQESNTLLRRIVFYYATGTDGLAPLQTTNTLWRQFVNLVQGGSPYVLAYEADTSYLTEQVLAALPGHAPFFESGENNTILRKIALAITA